MQADMRRIYQVSLQKQSDTAKFVVDFFFLENPTVWGENAASGGVLHFKFTMWRNDCVPFSELCMEVNKLIKNFLFDMFTWQK